MLLHYIATLLHPPRGLLPAGLKRRQPFTRAMPASSPRPTWRRCAPLRTSERGPGRLDAPCASSKPALVYPQNDDVRAFNQVSGAGQCYAWGEGACGRSWLEVVPTLPDVAAPWPTPASRHGAPVRSLKRDPGGLGASRDPTNPARTRPQHGGSRAFNQARRWAQA